MKQHRPCLCVFCLKDSGDRVQRRLRRCQGNRLCSHICSGSCRDRLLLVFEGAWGNLKQENTKTGVFMFGAQRKQKSPRGQRVSWNRHKVWTCKHKHLWYDKIICKVTNLKRVCVWEADGWSWHHKASWADISDWHHGRKSTTDSWTELQRWERWRWFGGGECVRAGQQCERKLWLKQCPNAASNAETSV